MEIVAYGREAGCRVWNVARYLIVVRDCKLAAVKLGCLEGKLYSDLYP